MTTDDLLASRTWVGLAPPHEGRLCGRPTGVATDSALGRAGLLLVAAAFVAKLTRRRALLAWIEWAGVGPKFFLEQSELSGPADFSVHVMGCSSKYRQHITRIELHQPPHDCVTDLP
jgi:hypothetical protein